MRKLVLQIPQHYKYKERAKYKKEIPLNRWHQRLLGLPKYKLPNITDMYKSEPTSDKWHQRLLGLPQKPWLLPITRQGTRYKVQVQNTQYKLANLGNITNTNRTYLRIGDTRARGCLSCSRSRGCCWCWRTDKLQKVHCCAAHLVMMIMILSLNGDDDDNDGDDDKDN